MTPSISRWIYIEAASTSRGLVLSVIRRPLRSRLHLKLKDIQIGDCSGEARGVLSMLVRKEIEVGWPEWAAKLSTSWKSSRRHTRSQHASALYSGYSALASLSRPAKLLITLLNGAHAHSFRLHSTVRAPLPSSLSYVIGPVWSGAKRKLETFRGHFSSGYRGPVIRA